MYFNWKAICKIAQECPQFALGLLALNPSSKVGMDVAKGIGHLFLTTKKTCGPVPWSAIVSYRDKDGGLDPIEACQHYGIPNFIFQLPNHKIEPGSGILPLPENLDYARMSKGDTFTWNNEKYIVLISGAGYALDFVPAKSVDMTC